MITCGTVVRLGVRWIGFALAGMVVLTLIGAEPAASQYNLRYYLEIDEETWNSLHVDITVSNNRAPQLYCGLPQGNFWPNLNSSAGCDISYFEVTDRYGAALTAQPISCHTWLIDTQGNDIINISYRVNGRKDLILGDRLSRNFTRVDPSAVFLFVREYLESPILLNVRVPHRWKLASGLPATEQAFEYRLRNYDELLRHPLYLAPFEEIYFKLEDRICYILIDGSKTAEINKLSSIATKIAYYQSKLFKDIPFDRYLFVFKVFSAQPVIAAAAYENVSICYFSYDHLKSNFDTIALAIASNFLRTWHGYRFGPQWMQRSIFAANQSTNSLWFYFGSNEYYAALSLVRIGYWSEADFINYELQTINRYFRALAKSPAPSLESLSRSVALTADASKIERLKLEGQLIALLLDLEIRKATQNQRSLDDVMFFMNQWFGARQLGYQDDDILRAIKAVTGAELSRFFDLYISSAHELPLADALQAAGVFVNTVPDSMADLGDFQMASEGNVITNVTQSSPLDVAGLKVGDRLVSINNRSINSIAQLDRLLETILIGQEVNITVQRDNAPLTLIAKVASKPIATATLVSSEPQTELQRLIRKTWLAKQLP